MSYHDSLFLPLTWSLPLPCWCWQNSRNRGDAVSLSCRVIVGVSRHKQRMGPLHKAASHSAFFAFVHVSKCVVKSLPFKRWPVDDNVDWVWCEVVSLSSCPFCSCVRRVHPVWRWEWLHPKEEDEARAPMSNSSHWLLGFIVKLDEDTWVTHVSAACFWYDTYSTGEVFAIRLKDYFEGVKKHPLAEIKMPTIEKLEEYRQAIHRRHPALPDVWGTMDGLKCLIERPGNEITESQFYNGWKSAHLWRLCCALSQMEQFLPHSSMFLAAPTIVKWLIGGTFTTNSSLCMSRPVSSL